MSTVDILKAGQTNWYTYKSIFPFIVQVGVGGTGGYLVQHIAQLLGTSKIKAAYVIADPDVIEEKNLGNQLFLPDEVGLKKADVLASRYSAAYGIDIGSYSETYVEDENKLRSLFSMEYMSMHNENEHMNKLFLPIRLNHRVTALVRQIYYNKRKMV